MKLSQRIKKAYKSMVGEDLGLSQSFGSVLRNYQKQQEFRPQQQLRGITYKAIDKIGMAVSEYEPKVEKPNGDYVINHPIYNLAAKPNPRQSGHYFHHLEAMMYEIYGETFWYLVRGESSRKIKEVYLLNPSQVELVVDHGELLGYVLHKPNGEQIPFELDEIHHDMRPNPFNEWRGMSVMEKAAQYIDIELVTTSFTLNYMQNNASPSGIVTLPSMTKEAFAQFKMQWREGYEGPQNAGKTAFINGGDTDFKAVGATLKDIDQKVTRDMAKDDVLMMFDMPKGLLGASGEKGMGRAETESLEYIFAKYKVEPMMDRLDETYEFILRDSYTQDMNAEICHETTIPDDKEYTLNTNDKGVGRWITVNEARATQGLPPLPDGDILDTAVAPPASTKSVKKIVLKAKESQSDLVKKLGKEREAFRKNLVDVNEEYSKKFKATMSKFAADQEDKVISNINATSKAYEEWLFNIKDEAEVLAAELTPIVIKLIETQGEDVANFITGELLTVSPELRKTVEQHILQISGVYNQDTIKALEKTLSEGQTAGESLVKLKKRVESVYSEAKGYRAERIARTETLKASNMTAEEVYKQNGYNNVQWFVNPGACEFCQSYANQTKEIGSSFTSIGDVVSGVDGGQMRIEYSDIDVPPLHPQCKCTIVPGES